MDTEEHTHLTKLRCAYMKRLRILELKQAKMGLHSPEHIFTEIEELSGKIAAIDVQLNGAAVPSALPPVSVGSSPMVQIDIVFKGDFDALTPELQERMIRVLAAFVDLPPDQIRVVKVMSGSVIFRVEMPKEEADRLLELYKSQDPAIEDVGIAEIRTVQVPTTIGSDLPDEGLARGHVTDRSVVQADCARVVALLRHELDLSSAQEAAYAQAVAAYLPARYNDSQLQRLVRCYHLDHQEVQALRDARHPGYQDAWAKWPPQVLRILRDANFAWLADSAIEVEDLVQIALKELHGSISSYRFSSRFSTWAYTVIVRAAQHTIREQRAAKRSGTQISLDDSETMNHLGSHTDDPAAVAQAAALTADILRILAEHGGPRSAEIFQRWALADQRLVDIGQQIGLSPARVSTLLNQMRGLLRQHADIVEWYRPAENQSDTRRRGEGQSGDDAGETTS